MLRRNHGHIPYSSLSTHPSRVYGAIRVAQIWEKKVLNFLQLRYTFHFAEIFCLHMGQDVSLSAHASHAQTCMHHVQSQSAFTIWTQVALHQTLQWYFPIHPSPCQLCGKSARGTYKPACCTFSKHALGNTHMHLQRPIQTFAALVRLLTFPDNQNFESRGNLNRNLESRGRHG